MNLLQKNIKVIGIFFGMIICCILVWKFAIGQDKPKGELVFSQDKPTIDYSKVVATVNGYKITEAEVEARVADLSPQMKAQFNSPSQKKKLIDRIVDEVLMEKAALDAGLTKDPKVAGELAIAKRQVLIKELSNKEIQKVKVTPEDIKKWYGEHLADLTQPESVHVKHILLKTEKDAKKVVTDLKKKGANFAKIASDVSLDSGSKQMGGDLGYLARGQTVPEFENVAFNTPVGKISEPFQSQFGWHILTVEDKKAAGPIPLEEVQPQIQERLKYELYIKPLKDKAKIDILESFPESGPGSVPPAK